VYLDWKKKLSIPFRFFGEKKTVYPTDIFLEKKRKL